MKPPSKIAWVVLCSIAVIALLIGLVVPVVVRQVGSFLTQSAEARAVPLQEHVFPETRRWLNDVPQGTQVCNGVTFLCQGAIRTAGLRAARDGKQYPGAVWDVPVQRRGSRIHLLQAAENSGGMADDAPYLRLRLHYANGEARHFDLLYSVHGREWFQNLKDPRVDDSLGDPNTLVGFEGPRKQGNLSLRLYHTTLENPLPRVEIVSADFISPIGVANPLVFGMAIDDDPRPLRPVPSAPESSSNQLTCVTVKLRDSAGHPVKEGTLSWVVSTTWRPPGRTYRVEFPQTSADAQGQVLIDVPSHFVGQIWYHATAADGLAKEGTVLPDERGAFPAATNITLTAAGTASTSPPQ